MVIDKSSGIVSAIVDGCPGIRQWTQTGSFVRVFGYGRKHTKGRRIQRPCCLALSSKSELIVTDHAANKILVYDKHGKFLRHVGSCVQMRRPCGIAIDCNDHVFVCDVGNRQVQIFDEDGDFLTSFLVPKHSTRICVSQDNRIFVEARMVKSRCMGFNEWGVAPPHNPHARDGWVECFRDQMCLGTVDSVSLSNCREQAKQHCLRDVVFWDTIAMMFPRNAEDVHKLQLKSGSLDLSHKAIAVIIDALENVLQSLQICAV